MIGLYSIQTMVQLLQLHPYLFEKHKSACSQVFDNFLLYIIREPAVGSPSAIEGQSANILISRTGL